MPKAPPLPARALLALLLLAALAPALLPTQAPAPVPANALGVNLHSPTQVLDTDDNRALWAQYRERIASLPAGTPLRVFTAWHEWAWDTRYDYGMENIRRMVQEAALAPGKPRIFFDVTPLPWPGAWGWSPKMHWGTFSESDLPIMVGKFKRFVPLFRAELAAAGLGEDRVDFGLGNEAGATHPGGNEGLPMGEWWERTGRAYTQMVSGTDFGKMRLVLPALSFQDADAGVAKLERDSAGPILRRIAAARRGGNVVSDVHVRLYAPELGTADYADRYALRVGAFRAVAKSLSGRDAICSEIYLFREDRPAEIDDRAEVLRLVASRLPAGCWVYRLGPGPNADSTVIELPGLVSAREAQVAAAAIRAAGVK